MSVSEESLDIAVWSCDTSLSQDLPPSTHDVFVPCVHQARTHTSSAVMAESIELRRTSAAPAAEGVDWQAQTAQQCTSKLGRLELEHALGGQSDQPFARIGAGARSQTSANCRGGNLNEGCSLVPFANIGSCDLPPMEPLTWVAWFACLGIRQWRLEAPHESSACRHVGEPFRLQ